MSIRVGNKHHNMMYFRNEKHVHLLPQYTMRMTFNGVPVKCNIVNAHYSLSTTMGAGLTDVIHTAINCIVIAPENFTNNEIAKMCDDAMYATFGEHFLPQDITNDANFDYCVLSRNVLTNQIGCVSLAYNF